MKKFFGLCILMVLLVAASGCTQPAPAQAPATPAMTPAPAPVATPQIIQTPVAPPVTTVSTIAVPARTIEKPEIVPQDKKIIFYFRNNTLSPKEMTVLPGTGVTWINDDKTVHSVATTGDHAGMFNSGDIIPTATWGYTFGADEGRYEFKDKYSGMTGVIIVKKGPEVEGAPPLQTPSTAK
jgi:plastocyanin